MTTKRASRASTGGSVLTGGAAGQVLKKVSGTNDDLAWGDISGTSYTNPTAAGLVIIDPTSNSTSETIVTGMSVSTLQPGAAVTVNLALWVSINDPSVTKTVTMRLRDGGISGTILQTVTRTMTLDSTAGHDQNLIFSGSVTPTTNTLVVTVQRTASSQPVWSDTRTFTITQSGGGFTPVGGTTGQVLTKTTNTDLNYGWATPAAGGGGSGSVGPETHAEFTLASWSTSAGVNTVSTPVIDSAKSNDSTFMGTPAANGILTPTQTGIYSFSARVPLNSPPGVRAFLSILVNGTEVSRAGLGDVANEDTLTVSAPGVYVVAGQQVQVSLYTATSGRTATGRIFATRMEVGSGGSGAVTTGTDTSLAATPQVLAVAAKSQVFGTTTISPLVDSLLVIHVTATISNSPTGNQGALIGPLVASAQTGGTLTGGRFSAGPAPVSPSITSMNQTIQNPLSGSTFGDSLYYLRAGVTYTIGYDLLAGSGAGSVTFSNIQSTYSTTPFGGGGSSGSWTTYTPADITAVTTNPSLGTSATKTGQYLNDGTTVKADLYYKTGTSPSVGSGSYRLPLPVPIVGMIPGQALGHGWIFETSVGMTTVQAIGTDANTFRLFRTSVSAFEFSSGNAFFAFANSELALHLDYRIR
jgi:hypothetical protein